MGIPLRRLAIDRRLFLRGTGVAIALPILDAMTPALSPEKDAPLRTVFIFAPNGKDMPHWTPKETGAHFELPKLLEPLAPLKKELLVLSGLALDGARAHGDGPGDHARAAAAFLTGAHPKKTGGSDILLAQSVDQRLADHRGEETEYRSLELGMEGGRAAGSCDSGYSCAYSNNIAWKSPTVPVAKETDPRAVFARLFGDPGDLGQLAARKEKRRRLASILDFVSEDAKGLLGKVGASDRNKLDQYFEAIRELERRFDRAAATEPEVEVPEDLALAGSGSFEDRLRLMYELIRLALQTDKTRTLSFMLGNAGSNRSYRAIGVPDGHHDLSHHRGDQSKLAGVHKINAWHMQLFADFLRSLQTTKEGQSNLLAQSAILYGSGIADGNAHNHEELPILLAGRLGGRLRTGQHLRFDKDTPLANLHLSLLQSLGVKETRFGDSTGRLPILAGV